MPRKTPIAFEETLHIIADAVRMGVDLNPEWGLNRIRREHDEWVKRDRAKRYSAATFASAWTLEKGGYSATLLTTPLEVAIEGGTMRHCVASYASYAQKGIYAVLRIDGKERATLGLNWTDSETNAWTLDQVYGVCNARVSEACRNFAIEVAGQFGPNKRKLAA